MMNRPERTIYDDERIAASMRTSRVEGNDGMNSTSQKLAITMDHPLEMAPTNTVPTGSNTAIATGQLNFAAARTKTSATAAVVATETNQKAEYEVPMPKRNLSAYNLFFQVERENIIKGEVGMNYTHENIARVAQRHYEQGKMTQPRRKHRKTHGKISFAELARSVASRWKQLDPSIKEMFIYRTNIEKARYQQEIAEWADRKLRTKPQLPKPNEQPSDQLTLVDMYRPEVPMFASFSDTATDPITYPIDLMPMRVFPPSNDHRNDNMQRQFREENLSDSHRLPFAHTPLGFGNVTHDDIRSLSRTHGNLNEPMNRLPYFAGDAYSGYATHGSNSNLQPSQMSYNMPMQHHFGMVVNEQRLPYMQRQEQQQQQQQLHQEPQSQQQQQQSQQPQQEREQPYGEPQPNNQLPPYPRRDYPTHFSMRSSSGEATGIQREGFASLPFENNNINEMFQRSIPSLPLGYGSTAHVPSHGQMQSGRSEVKSSDNENMDIQSLFRLFDANERDNI